MGWKGALGLIYACLFELIAQLPAILKTRREYRRARRLSPHSEPWVACIGDNLDEVNGIALASRIQLRELRRQGHQAFLLGVAFHTKQPRVEDPDQVVIFVPGKYSVD